MLSEKQIKDIEELDQHRWSGQWKAIYESLDDLAKVDCDGFTIEIGSDADGCLTAEFIAAASWAIPALVKEVKQQRGRGKRRPHLRRVIPNRCDVCKTRPWKYEPFDNPDNPKMCQNCYDDWAYHEYQEAERNSY